MSFGGGLIFRSVLTCNNLKDVLSRVLRTVREFTNFTVPDVDDRLETNRNFKNADVSHPESYQTVMLCEETDKYQWVDLIGVPTGLYLWTSSVLFCMQLLSNPFFNYGINSPHLWIPGDLVTFVSAAR